MVVVVRVVVVDGLAGQREIRMEVFGDDLSRTVPTVQTLPGT